jgi:hypothetical protein
MEYARLPIGGESFLLPKSSELSLVEINNSQNLNRTRFSGCRQYTGESVLSFGDPTELAAARPVQKEVELSEGMYLDMSLQAPVSTATSAVGDPITAVLQRNIKKGGDILIPKGALVHGRLTVLRRRDPSGFSVGFNFFEIEHPTVKAPVNAILDELSAAGMLTTNPAIGRLRAVASPPPVQVDPTLGSIFFVRGDKVDLGRGFRMYWRVRSNPEGKK